MIQIIAFIIAGLGCTGILVVLILAIRGFVNCAHEDARIWREHKINVAIYDFKIARAHR